MTNKELITGDADQEDTPTCPDCGVDTYYNERGEEVFCGMCSAERARHEPGTGCM
jgi:hypothetical protein